MINGFDAPFGFAADVSYPVSGPLAVVGQADWLRSGASVSGLTFSVKNHENFATFGGGVRWTARESGVNPYLHAFVGATRSSFSGKVSGQTPSSLNISATDRMFQFGGGMVLKNKWSPVTQIDYRRIGSINSIRMVAGIRVELK